MTTVTKTKCSHCGNELNEEELDDSERNKGAHSICDECYHNHFEFTCCLCDNYGNIADQHNMIVVAKPTRASGRRRRIGRGVYRVSDMPYYGGSMIGESYLFADALKRLCSLPEGVDTDGYPVGHLCKDCQERVAKAAPAPPSERSEG